MSERSHAGGSKSMASRPASGRAGRAPASPAPTTPDHSAARRGVLEAGRNPPPVAGGPASHTAKRGDPSTTQPWLRPVLGPRPPGPRPQCAEEARVKLASLHPGLLVLGELEHPHAPLGLLRGIRSGATTPFSSSS